MIQNGLLEEVKSLLPHQSLNALQTVGYRELFAFTKRNQLRGGNEQLKIQDDMQKTTYLV